ncbi:MAG: hypothetical protein IT379_42235 [Deltaproteobacteria bacterium]|nr:hypothetical protein [Deltaproteobacteria bacterium]
MADLTQARWRAPWHVVSYFVCCAVVGAVTWLLPMWPFGFPVAGAYMVCAAVTATGLDRLASVRHLWTAGHDDLCTGAAVVFWTMEGILLLGAIMIAVELLRAVVRAIVPTRLSENDRPWKGTAREQVRWLLLEGGRTPAEILLGSGVALVLLIAALLALGHLSDEPLRVAAFVLEALRALGHVFNG